MDRISGRRKVISSGDLIVDFLFSRIINALNYTVEHISLRKRVFWVSPKAVRELYGLTTENLEIYISTNKKMHADRRAMAKTLLHEAMHVVFDRMRERHVLRFEDLLWDRLSEDQRQLLACYLPRPAGGDYYSK